jgi:hypothetical protein
MMETKPDRNALIANPPARTNAAAAHPCRLYIAALAVCKHHRHVVRAKLPRTDGTPQGEAGSAGTDDYDGFKAASPSDGLEHAGVRAVVA